MDIGDAINASKLAARLGISHTKATGLLRKTGPGFRLGNSTYYNRDQVKAVVWTHYAAVFDFLDLPLSPADSYDVLINRSEDMDA